MEREGEAPRTTEDAVELDADLLVLVAGGENRGCAIDPNG